MSDRRARFRRYILAWFAACSAALLAIILINGLMDAYRIFGTPTFSSINRIKPEVVKNDRAAKAAMLLRVAPDALILGNSRSLNGIPTRHPAWAGFTVFNGALTAGRIEEALDILRFAHAHRPLRRVLLNIDELVYRSGVHPTVGANPNRYQHKLRGQWVRAKDWAGALLTDRALRASLRTWNARHGQLMPSDAAVINEDGTIDQDIFHQAIAARGGAREAFRRVEAQARANPGNASHLDVSGPAATLREILIFGRRNGIEITIYFPPIHARALAEKQMNGTLSELFEVRRSVINVVTHEAEESDGSQARVADFLALTEQTLESIPPAGNHAARMTWFFEGSHFTHAYGSRILNCLFLTATGTSAQPTIPAPTECLGSTTSALVSIDQSIRQWIEMHPTEIKELSVTNFR